MEILKLTFVKYITAGSGFKLANLVIEYINRGFVINIKNNRNLTYNLREIFIYCAVLKPIANTLRKILENFARIRINSKYYIILTNNNIIYYAYLLF